MLFILRKCVVNCIDRGVAIANVVHDDYLQINGYSYLYVCMCMHHTLQIAKISKFHNYSYKF